MRTYRSHIKANTNTTNTKNKTKYKSYAPFNNKRHRHWPFPCAQRGLRCHCIEWPINATLSISLIMPQPPLPLFVPTLPLDSHLQRKSSRTCESKNSNNSESWTQKKAKRNIFKEQERGGGEGWYSATFNMRHAVKNENGNAQQKQQQQRHEVSCGRS